MASKPFRTNLEELESDVEARDDLRDLIDILLPEDDDTSLAIFLKSELIFVTIIFNIIGLSPFNNTHVNSNF